MLVKTSHWASSLLLPSQLSGLKNGWQSAKRHDLSLDDHLERSRVRRVHEHLIGLEDAVQLESVSNQGLEVYLVRLHNLHQPSSAWEC